MNRIIDKDFCLSSYMAFRYIYKDNYDFFGRMQHQTFKGVPKEERVKVRTANEIDFFIKKQIDNLYRKHTKIGILLSGGMDSAVLATYLKPGSNAYTFRTNLSNTFDADIERSEKYCRMLGLNHIYIDIDFDDYKKYTPIVMQSKSAPVHSIEPQLYKAAIEARKQGDELIIEGDGADYIFGGVDKLLSKDWRYGDFVERYTYLNPTFVLNNPVDISDFFEKYRLADDMIDFWGIITHACLYANQTGLL